MITVRAAILASRRPGRIGLFLGLAVLVTAHIAGAVHSSSFAGPHLGVEVVAQVHPSVGVAHGPGQPPGHRHDAEDHLDHAVDRPRSGPDAATAGPGHADPAIAPAVMAAAASATFPDVPRTGPPHACPAADGPDTLALHCVWRQ
ncbi:hypothetical protein [Streptomyces shenzhenensis]|uniref:hypothetical protein n=1 Tax=Streptomyces shenzhenensis TaxID=943815 RepID=UPI00368516D6